MRIALLPNFLPLRSGLILVIMGVVILQVVFLSPSVVEQDDASNKKRRLIDPRVLLQEFKAKGPFLAPGIPMDRLPEESMDDFVYTSSKGNKKEWRIQAVMANRYKVDELVHGTKVIAQLYDEKQEATIVTGNEAKYYSRTRQIEVFGDVHTRFPDGFTIRSEYMQYNPAERQVFIPIEFLVRGHSAKNEKSPNAEELRFTSQGLTYHLDNKLANLPKDVHFVTEKISKEGNEFTSIDSDHSLIDRNTSIAHFTMLEDRPLEEKFVRFVRNNLFMNARRLDLYYAGQGGTSSFQKLIAFDDVFIREMGIKDVLRYGTCGRADYDAKKNVVVLTQYPQVYQNNDTVTGERIIIYRDQDVVEVERSNAFNY